MLRSLKMNMQTRTIETAKKPCCMHVAIRKGNVLANSNVLYAGVCIGYTIHLGDNRELIIMGTYTTLIDAYA